MSVGKTWWVMFGLLACGEDKDVEDTAVPGEPTSVTGTTGTTGTTSTTTTLSDSFVAEWGAEVHENMGSIVVVTWEQLQEAQVWWEYSFDEDIWLSTPIEMASKGPQEQLLLGVPFGTEVEFKLQYQVGEDTLTAYESTLTTGDAPDGLVDSVIISMDEDRIDPAIPWFLMSMEGSGRSGPWTVVIDRQGRYVWAVETTGGYWTMHTQTSYDGTSFLIDRNSFWGMFDAGASSQVIRMRIDGSIVDIYDTPGLHHPFTELPDGSIAWGAAQSFFGGDETLDIRRPDGTYETLWSCEAWQDSVGFSESCGSNTLRWHEPSGVFLYSFYTFETVIEIDGETGVSNRWFGHAPESWGFDPEESIFYWQHGGHYTDSGTFLTSSESWVEGHETVVREYELDEKREVLVEVFNFGLGEGVYGATMGEAHWLPSGNILHNYGDEVRLREGTPDGDVVWDIGWPSASEQIGRSTPLESLYPFVP